MCGLFGFVDLNGEAGPHLARARAALTRLAHRGPDQWSDYTDRNVYLGHRRLSILDLSEAGRQPMSDVAGSVVITVNGEIYNYKELRARLRGSTFRSESDSEVALHGYREWGVDEMLERIDGMYAMALYDVGRRRIVLARDRAGIKPLYYARVSGFLVWASELKAIESFLSSTPLKHDGTALYDFLTYRYIPAPKTAYEQIRKLPPAHVLTFDVESGDMRVSRYWKLEVADVQRSTDDAAEELRSRVEESVRSHLASDVPLGCFLSGGVDSSVVTAHAQRLAPGIQTFCIGFDDPAYDETAYAEEVARAFHTTHRVRRLVRDDSVDLIPWMRSLYDEPFGDYSALPTWHVSRFARERVTVALSGDGGDELFGGYPWYRRIHRIMRMRGNLAPIIERMPILPYTKRPKSKWRSVFNRVSLYATMGLFELYVVLMNGVPWSVRQSYRALLGVPDDYDDYWFLRQHYMPSVPLRKRLQVMDFHTYLPEDILTKVDRASMAVSLESRVPLLSRSLVEFAFSLPEEFLYLGGELKGGFKYAYRDVLPRLILERAKKGFGIPVRQWDLLGDLESFEIGVLREYQEHRAA